MVFPASGFSSFLSFLLSLFCAPWSRSMNVVLFSYTWCNLLRWLLVWLVLLSQVFLPTTAMTRYPGAKRKSTKSRSGQQALKALSFFCISCCIFVFCLLDNKNVYRLRILRKRFTERIFTFSLLLFTAKSSFALNYFLHKRRHSWLYVFLYSSIRFL